MLIGENVEIAGQRGIFRSITATHVVLEGENATEISVANATFLDQVAKQALRASRPESPPAG